MNNADVGQPYLWLEQLGLVFLLEDPQNSFFSGEAGAIQALDLRLVLRGQGLVHVGAKLLFLLGEDQPDLKRLVRGHAEWRLSRGVLRGSLEALALCLAVPNSRRPG